MRYACYLRLLPAVAALALFVEWASAHPSSGIVVDENGNVFVADINTGLWKIGTEGKLTHLHQEAGHWLALDAAGNFARVDFTKSDRWPRWFKRRTPDGAKPVLITDGGSPLVTPQDGNLYYVSSGEHLQPGGHEVIRLTPDGKLDRVVTDLAKTSEKLGGIKGLATGPDGALYLSYPKAVLRITLDGKVTTLADPVVVTDGDKDLPAGTPESQLPSLRGLAVDDRGTVYAAATGCRCVVKIQADGKVGTVLKAERPWSPTGVALQGGALYVLEYPNANGERHADWVPRVRKVGRNGTITTLVTFPKKD
jgi:DNA-binding beta-propeller fold protein YncE